MPDFLRAKTTLFKPVTSWLVLCVFFIPAQALPTHSPAEKQIFDQLNQAREKAGFPVLEWNDLLADAARRHARMLSQHEELSHQYPGEASLPERIGAAGVRFTRAGENIARTELVEDVHPALMNSPGHRGNILNPSYNAVGIGLVEDKGKLYVTQDFIFLVPVYSEAEFTKAFAEGFNLSRRSQGLKEIEVRPDPLFHNLACSTDGNATRLSGSVSGKYLVVFTSSEPRLLPLQMQKAAAAPDYHRMIFGVCFRPDKDHGYANFWVVVAFQGG